MGCSNTSVKNGTRAVFLLGGPFSGKSKQCLQLKETFDWSHIQVQELLKEKNAEKLNQMENAIKASDIIPSTEMISIIKEEICQRKHTQLLLDGFPTSIENINEWEKRLNDIFVPCVFYFKCSIETMKARMELVCNERTIDQAVVNIMIEDYEKNISPVIEKYEKLGKLIVIDGEKSSDEVFNDLKKAFVSQKLVE